MAGPKVAKETKSQHSGTLTKEQLYSPVFPILGLIAPGPASMKGLQGFWLAQWFLSFLFEKQRLQEVQEESLTQTPNVKTRPK